MPPTDNVKFLELGDGTGPLPPLHFPDIGTGFWEIWDPLTAAPGDGFTMTGPGTGVPAGSIGDIDNTGGSGAYSEIFAELELDQTYEIGDEFYTDMTWLDPGSGHNFQVVTFSILMSHTPFETDRQAERGWLEIAVWVPHDYGGGGEEVEISGTSFTLGNFWDFYSSFYTAPGSWEKGGGMRVGARILSMVQTGPTVSNPNTYDGNDENWDMELQIWTEPHGGGTRTVLGVWNVNIPHNWLEYHHFLLYTLTDSPCPNYTIEEICIHNGCSGGSGNPFPHFPPPVPPIAPGLQVYLNRAWRLITDAWQMKNRTYRKVFGEGVTVTDPLAIEFNKAYRNVLPIDFEHIPDELPGGVPTWYDPCGILPVLPPVGDLIPLTSRFFGINQAPVSITGDLLNGNKFPVGYWTAGDLVQAAAKGVTIITNSAGRTGFLLGGRIWNKEYWLDQFMIKYADVISSGMLVHPNHFGLIILDDVRSKILWPPNGIPSGDLTWCYAAAKTLLPDVRIGLRDTITAFGGDLGYDFYICQLVDWKDTAFNYAVREYGACVAAGKWCCLDNNYMSGDGSSGFHYVRGTLMGMDPTKNFEQSPTEIANNLIGLCDGAMAVDGTAALLAGMMGYTYDPDFLARPGILDGMTIGRNAMAALPDLP